MAWVKPRQRKDGSVYFCVFFREVNHTTGKSQQTSISWDDPNDAERCRQLVEQVGPDKAREILKIVQTPGQAQTVRQFLIKHIDHLTGVDDATPKRYRAYVANDIGPAFGEVPLTALNRDHIARWVLDMQQPDEDTGKVASGKTIANKHGFLAGALNAAVRDELIKANPCDGNRLPRWDREEMVFLERDEYQILRASTPEYWRPLVEFLVTSGCRWSEATALRPGDVDRTAGTVRVSKAWKPGVDGGYKLGVPKTKKSVRTINIPPSVVDQLDFTGPWLFTNSGRGKGNFGDGAIRDDTGPVRIHSFNPNVWAPAVKRAIAAGLTKKPRTYDLRHTCASWLIQAGRPLPAVQAHLGHESITTTVGVYGHLDRSSGKGNADAIAAMLG